MARCYPGLVEQYNFKNIEYLRFLANIYRKLHEFREFIAIIKHK